MTATTTPPETATPESAPGKRRRGGLWMGLGVTACAAACAAPLIAAGGVVTLGATASAVLTRSWWIVALAIAVAAAGIAVLLRRRTVARDSGAASDGCGDACSTGPDASDRCDCARR